MTDVDKLVALGMAPELAATVVSLIAASVPTAAEINAAVSAKEEIADLTGASTAANIVSALQA